MKCNRCSKPATFHITDIAKGVPQEFHLCEDHARQHLAPEEPDDTPEGQVSAVAKGLVKSSSLRDTSELDRQTCPVCGISFLEFRNAGRLGCPHDYDVFRAELIPL